MAKYIVTAEPKAQAVEKAAQVQFVIEQPGYKQAWIAGRNICRVGGEVTDEKGQSLIVTAGQLTVRKVFAVETKKASKVITADALIAAAEDAGIKVPAKLAALLASLRTPTADKPAADEPTDETAAA